MNVLDSSAWVGYLMDESCADKLVEPLTDVGNLLVPSITLTEVFKYVARVRNTHTAFRAVAQMTQGRVIALDEALAIKSARCGLQFKLPLADSIIYATARCFSAVLWTLDSDFEDLPGVQFLA